MKKTFPGIIRTCILFATGIMLFTNCTNRNMTIKTLPYPDSRPDSTVTDNYHGTVVVDPYRWLEDDNSEETARWVAAQNEVTEDYLSQIPYRQKVRDRLTELWNYPKEGAPSRHGDWYYSMRNDGLQNQSVIYRQRTLASDPELFMDPNKLSDDGTVSLSAMSFSENGKFFAYSVSESGSDWVEIKVIDTETFKETGDHIKWVKFSGARWDAASEGFYYSRYDEPAPGSELSGQNQFQKVYYHKLGDEQSADKLIYSDPRHALRYFNAIESRDGKYIFVNGSEGTHGAEVLFRPVSSDGPFRVLFPGFSNDYAVIDCFDDKAYVYTNQDAPNYRLVAINLTGNDRSLTDIIPENNELLLEDVSKAGNYFMASYLENACNAVYQYRKDGTFVRKVDLPDIGSAVGFGAKKEDTETFYTMNTFTSPSAVYRYDIETGESTIYRRPEVNFDSELYMTEQIFFRSKDGTSVPMFVVRKKDIKLDGNNPLYLYGYGGFNISLTPGFSPSALMFMEQGGIYVMVNLRGGGEYGEKWHRGGMLENKQNVFDDFIGAAEYLIDKGYTSKDKIAIAGGSNGGLLVGACMTQRPDLFAVAFPQVGVLDMLRYHMFTVGWGWVVEYGSSENPDQFPYIYEYSPLHNLRPGTCYPATMITTADHDDRVVPAHSFKFAATLQAVQSCDNPTLIRIETKAGHGAGKPTSKRIEEAADMYSFMFWNTGTKVKF